MLTSQKSQDNFRLYAPPMNLVEVEKLLLGDGVALLIVLKIKTNQFFLPGYLHGDS